MVRNSICVYCNGWKLSLPYFWIRNRLPKFSTIQILLLTLFRKCCCRIIVPAKKVKKKDKKPKLAAGKLGADFLLWVLFLLLFLSAGTFYDVA